MQHDNGFRFALVKFMFYVSMYVCVSLYNGRKYISRQDELTVLCSFYGNFILTMSLLFCVYVYPFVMPMA
jgi:hypothetical protein